MEDAVMMLVAEIRLALRVFFILLLAALALWGCFVWRDMRYALRRSGKTRAFRLENKEAHHG